MSTRKVCLGLAMSLPLAAMATPAVAEVPIVYSRCKRTEASVTATATVTVAGSPKKVTRVLRHSDIADALPDVENLLGGFTAPCDLVYRDATGKERVLYDCATGSTPTSTCAALDAAVDFDAKTIAFSVFRGPLVTKKGRVAAKFFDPAATDTALVEVPLPNAYLAATEARLFLVEVATGKVTPLPHARGVFDSGPAFLASGKIIFSSTRGNHYSTTLGFRDRRATRLYVTDRSGRDVEEVGHHGLGGDISPMQLRSGRVAFSSWQVFGMLAYRHEPTEMQGNLITAGNYFQVMAQRPDGADMFPIFGMHLEQPRGTGKWPAHHASHFITQGSDGRLWVTDYYRRDSLGLGAIYGMKIPPAGQEGFGPDDKPSINDIYRPRTFTVLAAWARSTDEFAPAMPAPALKLATYRDPLAYAGKLGHPSGLAGGQLLLTYGAGACGHVAVGTLVGDKPFTSGEGLLVAMNTLTMLGKDNPGCDAGIYRTTRVPSLHPSDLAPIVNSRAYHEIMARPVIPYRDVHGVARPASLPRAELVPSAARRKELPWGTPFGLLGAASMILRESRSIDGHPFSKKGAIQWILQGTDTADYKDDDICGLRILGVQPNQKGEVGRFRSPVGERLMVLGEIPLRKKDRAGKVILDYTGKPDTSFLVRFPANSPYLMQSVDCEGRTLATDQTWQSLKPGEVKTCGGCHVHGKPGLTFSRTAAGLRGFRPTRLGEGKVPLLAGGTVTAPKVVTRTGFGVSYEFARDVWPIFQRRCVSCHGGPTPAAGLALDRPGVGAGSTYHRLVYDASQKYVPASRRFPGTLYRPQLTKYVRALAARGSLLYWKAAGRRMDGRTDAQYGPGTSGWEDVDFGPAHRTAITSDELAVLGRWIDLGAGAMPDYVLDTTAPVVNLTGKARGGALASVQVGTADSGTGVAPSEIEVCVVPRGKRTCGPNLLPRAPAAGVVEVGLPKPLSDRGDAIRVRVADWMGNVTVVEHTVGWLLDLAASRPAPGGGTRGPSLKPPSIDDGCSGPAGTPGSAFSWLGIAVLMAGARLFDLLRRRR